MVWTSWIKNKKNWFSIDNKMNNMNRMNPTFNWVIFPLFDQFKTKWFQLNPINLVAVVFCKILNV